MDSGRIAPEAVGFDRAFDLEEHLVVGFWDLKKMFVTSTIRSPVILVMAQSVNDEAGYEDRLAKAT